MITKFGIIFLLIFLLIPYANAKNLENSSILEASASEMTIESGSGKIVMTDNVSVKLHHGNISADKIVVLYNSAKNEDMDIKNLDKVELYGHITAIFSDKKLTCDTAVYSAKTSIMIFEGNVKLLDERSLIEAEKLTYNTLTKELKVSSINNDKPRPSIKITK